MGHDKLRKFAENETFSCLLQPDASSVLDKTEADNNRQKMQQFKELLELESYLKKQNMVEQFATYANSHGLQRRNLLIKKSHSLLERYIDSRVIYNMLDEQAWNQYLNADDNVIKKALEVFKNNAAFPKLRAKKAKR